MKMMTICSNCLPNVNSEQLLLYSITGVRYGYLFSNTDESSSTTRSFTASDSASASVVIFLLSLTLFIVF